MSPRCHTRRPPEASRFAHVTLDEHACPALYVDPVELHHIDACRILRYDLTLPLLLTVRYEGQPLRIWLPARRTAPEG